MKSKSDILYRRFNFIPAFALTDDVGQSWSGYLAPRWFAAYQWFVQKLFAYKEKISADYLYEYINGTSSIRNTSPNVIYNVKEPLRRLRYLISSTGAKNGHADFLRFCGLKKLSDLNKPITITIPHYDAFPSRDPYKISWFELCGRIFNESQNSCHPQATWVQSSGVQLNYDGTLWKLEITYGYKHDSSSWDYNISQSKGESLLTFTRRCNAEIEKLFIPDKRYSMHRLADEREWRKKHDALDNIFYSGDQDAIDWEKSIADTLNNARARKIILTSERLSILKEWANAKI